MQSKYKNLLQTPKTIDIPELSWALPFHKFENALQEKPI